MFWQKLNRLLLAITGGDREKFYPGDVRDVPGSKVPVTELETRFLELFEELGRPKEIASVLESLTREAQQSPAADQESAS